MRIDNTGFMLLILMCCACSSLKNTKQFLQQLALSETNSYSRNNEIRQSSNKELITDSSNTAYDVQITPLGPFTYNTLSGFQGTATKVILRGKQQRKTLQQREAASLRHLKQANLVKDKREYHKVAKTQVKTRRTIAAWLWVSLFIAALSGCLYLLVRYWRSRHL